MTAQLRIQGIVLALMGLSCPIGWCDSGRRGGPDAASRAAARRILETAAVQGGLVVHLGCGNGRLTAALHENDRYVVQGLDSDPQNVRRARDYVDSIGLYGPVSIDYDAGGRLPYAENLINLLVVEDPARVSQAEMMRVLAPRGVACIRAGEGWRKMVKPWPADIDEWTHYLHGPDNNSVAQDSVVGPPRRFQWIAEPRFSRSHDHLASVSVVVSSGGRLFSIVDMGSIAFAGASPRWRLVARGAFSGVRLWVREIPRWEYHLRDFRSGPADLARRLVAVGDRVYVTLGYGRPVTALDAATGETIQTYAGTEGAHEIILYKNTLLAVLGKPDRNWPAEAKEAEQIVSQPGYHPPFERDTPPARDKQLVALDARTGDLKWRDDGPDTRDLMPTTLAASDDRVFYENADAVVCLDAKTGDVEWKTPRPIQRQRLAWSTPTLVVYDGVVYSADRRAVKTDGEILWMPSGGYHEYIRGEDAEGELIALDAKTGKRLWSCPAYEGFDSPVDVMIADGLLWTGRFAWGNDPGVTQARDPKTGQVLRRRPADQTFMRGIGHARCHRVRATSKYLIMGRRGVECIDLKTGRMVANRWVRGICQYGVIPANGLLYAPPHSCACSFNDQLKSGFMALAPERSRDAQADAPRAGDAKRSNRLEQGPAYASASSSASSRSPSSADWPTYRHDPGRSGATSAGVSRDLRAVWRTNLGGKLTAPVIADDTVLVAGADEHRVYALDAATGKKRWTCVTGARVDSPPTIDRGRAFFGSADGWVYCLRLDDGELIWRFRAAPGDRRIVANEQLESAWPVSGSVLVVNDAVFFTAGRNSYLDGGMLLYKLDAATGKVLKVANLAIEPKRRDSGVASVGYLPDVLSSDGRSIFLRSARFDLNLARQEDNVPHLWSPVGFLDDSWWHRTYWQIGVSMGSGWGRWPKAGLQVPSGRLLVTDGSRVFGFGRNQYDIPGAHVGVDAEGVWGPIGPGLSRWTYYRLFGKSLGGASGGKSSQKTDHSPEWTRRIPVIVRAMLLADQTLLVAGPSDPVRKIPRDPADVDPLAQALEAVRGGRLLALSPADGEVVAEYELASPPVFDGMAAAAGRLYLAARSGELSCMGPAR